MSFIPLSEREESIARKIVDAVPNAFGIHKKLGPGLLEKVYEVCFCHELSKRGLKYQRQVDILPIASGYMMGSFLMRGYVQMFSWRSLSFVN